MNREDRDELARRAVVSARPNQKGWARGNCPFCALRVGKPDTKACFGLNMNNGRMHCFRCGFGGRLDGFEPDAKDETQDGPEEILPPEEFAELSEEPLRSSLAAAPYWGFLSRRRVPKNLVVELGIGACLTGKYGGRVVVPVKDEEGQWLWWVSRTISDKAERKYRYPSGSRDGVMFNQAALLEETDKPALIVEGVLDAISVWPDGVALLGKESGPQVEALAAARRPVVIVYDGDAWEAGWALGLRLRFEGQEAGSVRLLPREDPDEVDVGELRAAARRSLFLVDPARI